MLCDLVTAHHGARREEGMAGAERKSSQTTAFRLPRRRVATRGGCKKSVELSQGVRDRPGQPINSTLYRGTVGQSRGSTNHSARPHVTRDTHIPFHFRSFPSGQHSPPLASHLNQATHTLQHWGQSRGQSRSDELSCPLGARHRVATATCSSALLSSQIQGLFVITYSNFDTA